MRREDRGLAVEQHKQQRKPRIVHFGESVRKQIKPGFILGPYLLDKMEEANISQAQFCFKVDHMYESKFRDLVRGHSRGVPTGQLIQFADITRSDPVEMIYRDMKDQSYWQGRPEEELRAKAIATYLLELVPRLPDNQQESLYEMVKVMAKQQGIVKK